jgi:lysophospholipase L1-like esterase
MTSLALERTDVCPGCRGFVDRYADAIQDATGRPVDVDNQSQHNGLTLPGLLDELDRFGDRLSNADIIVVGIAHNSSELASDTPCGGTIDAHNLPDWSKMDEACAVASAERYRPQYDSLYSQIAGLRAGKPTILRTINRYNDLNGWPEVNIGPAEAQKTKVILDQWNTMLCTTAANNGFACADIYTAFNGPDGLTPSGDLLAHDYTHPSDKGNELIAKVLADLGFEPLGPASTTDAATPVGVIAIGHSGLTGENSDPKHPRQEAKENSWATGTAADVNSIYTRLIAIRAETEGHVANTAQGGAVARSLSSQATAALAVVPRPALVIIQTIDNDIRCDGTDRQARRRVVRRAAGRRAPRSQSRAHWQRHVRLLRPFRHAGRGTLRDVDVDHRRL